MEGRFFPLLLYSATLAAGLLHALILFRLGGINIGQVVGYFGLLLLLDFPTWSSMWAYSQISLGRRERCRILELLNLENNLDQNFSGYNHEMRGKIEFKDVTFAYGGAEPVLANISFKVKPGQTVAIVGQTGSGKTSLVKLVNRTYDVTQGKSFN